MSASPNAVFLSYASQDADAARRIAEALRAAGVNVWFDQNEPHDVLGAHGLVGGDAWDAKIRQQIRECALFVPVISANTQARREGYFRREWKQAAERTRDMADGTPFLLPVVIDESPNAEALVPEEFRAVQWIRLSPDEASVAFVNRVQTLLERRAAKAHERVATTVVASIAPTQRAWQAWTVGSTIVVLLALFGWWRWSHPDSTPPALGVSKNSTPAKAGPESPTSPAIAAAPRLGAKSIAVLPFENLSPDQENEYFADGMHDEVITSLSKIRDLTVIARASVMSYRGAESQRFREIAAELGVATILEGRVRRAGNQVKVTVELIDVPTGQVLWANPFTENLTDIFTIQEKLAAAITSALKATLAPREKTLIARRPTKNRAAYDLFLRARALDDNLGDSGTRVYMDEIATLYEQAVAQDPEFLQAYVQLALHYGQMYWYGHLDPTPARKAQVQAMRDAALKLAPDAPETRLAVGAYLYYCENDWASALTEFKTAEAGLPGDAQVFSVMGNAQRRLGQLPAALASYARSIALNPRDQTARIQQVWTLALLRRYGDIVALGVHVAAQSRDENEILTFLAEARLELTRDRAAYLEALRLVPPRRTDPIGAVQAYRVAVASADWPSAERALESAQLSFVTGTASVIHEPVTLHRAGLAFLQGDRERARALAQEAKLELANQTWTRRQEAWGMGSLAMAHALAGETEEALRLVQEAYALQQARDACDAMYQRPDLARIYLVLGRYNEALAFLHEMMTEPCLVGPEQVRMDPLWSRIRDDPRLEETLQLARPL
jgi:TolB-like protein